jgi:hypothetical protein
MPIFEAPKLSLFVAAGLLAVVTPGPAQAQTYATEWINGNAVISGAANTSATGVNDAGAAVGYSIDGINECATEWNAGSSINLG